VLIILIGYLEGACEACKKVSKGYDIVFSITASELKHVVEDAQKDIPVFDVRKLGEF
jgi:hypothetical protein